MTHAHADRQGRTLFWIAFGAGLMLRLVILSQTGQLGTMIVDEQHYAQLATTVVRDGVYGMDALNPTSIRPPLFPGMVAALWSLTGVGHLQVVRVVNIVLALITTGLVFLLGRDLFDSRIGRLGAAAFWLYPSLIFFNFTILTESLFTCLFMLAIWLLVRLVRQPGAWGALACGAAIGLAALTRSVLWPFPLVLCPVLALIIPRPLQQRVALAALVLVGHVAVLTPWSMRNTRLQGVLTVVDTMGGENLRMGNYEHTPDDRMWAAVELTGEKNWAYALHQEQPDRDHFTEGEKDKWAQRKALEYIVANPGITLRRSVIKVSDFWGLEREYAAGVQQGIYAPPAWFGLSASGLIIVVYVLVSLLGLAGFWLTPTDLRTQTIVVLPLLGILGGHALAFGHSRYHVPLMPVFGIFAVALAAQGFGAVRRARGWQLAGAALSVTLLLAIWVYQVLIVDAARIRALLQVVVGS